MDPCRRGCRAVGDRRSLRRPVPPRCSLWLILSTRRDYCILYGLSALHAILAWLPIDSVLPPDVRTLRCSVSLGLAVAYALGFAFSQRSKAAMFRGNLVLSRRRRLRLVLRARVRQAEADHLCPVGHRSGSVQGLDAFRGSRFPRGSQLDQRLTNRRCSSKELIDAFMGDRRRSKTRAQSPHKLAPDRAGRLSRFRAPALPAQ